MVLLKTPHCEFDLAAPDFLLEGVDGKQHSLASCRGEKGLLVMFICNHCPYVKAILSRLTQDVRVLQAAGIGCVAISANDPLEYPEDSLENMKALSDKEAFTFPYLFDETQAVAKAFGAVCTPDFFGYNASLGLQYRGRLDESGRQAAPAGAKRELVEALLMVAEHGKGPEDQIASQGCSIKWKEEIA